MLTRNCAGDIRPVFFQQKVGVTDVLRRAEIGQTGFFGNGGTQACVGITVENETCQHARRGGVGLFGDVQFVGEVFDIFVVGKHGKHHIGIERLGQFEVAGGKEQFFRIGFDAFDNDIFGVYFGNAGYQHVEPVVAFAGTQHFFGFAGFVERAGCGGIGQGGGYGLGYGPAV